MVAVEGAAEVVVVEVVAVEDEEVVAVEDEEVVAEVSYIQSHSSVVFLFTFWVAVGYAWEFILK